MNKNTEENLSTQIMKIINEWNFELKNLAKRKDIVAINFGAQKVFNGFELYLSGHTWFDGNDLWLLDEEWNPTTNYISLGPDTFHLDRLYFLEVLENIIQIELTQSAIIYKNLIVTVGLVDSDYKRIK